MGRGEAVIVAGIGCRRGCPAADIVALVRSVWPVDGLAAPAWKRDEPGLLEAARLLALPLHFVEEDALAAVQALCPTRSAVIERVTGFASVAEAAALAGGGTLRRARFGGGSVTCAVAQRARGAPSVGCAATSPASQGRTILILPCEAGEGDHAKHGGGGAVGEP